MKKLPVLLLSVCWTASLFAVRLHVRADDPVYRFIDRMITAGFVTGVFNDELPLARERIAGCLEQLHTQRDKLGSADIRLLDHYRALYYRELGSERHPQIAAEGKMASPFLSFKNLWQGIKGLTVYEPAVPDKRLFVYETGDDLIWVEADKMIRFEFKNDLYRRVEHEEVRFATEVGSSFTLYMDLYKARNNTVDGFTGPVPENKYPFVSHNPENGWYDWNNSDAYVQYVSRYGTFMLAHETPVWGNGKNPLIFSDNAAPFGFIKWERDFYKSRFSFIHGELLPATGVRDTFATGQGYDRYDSKYVVAHRADLRPVSWWNIGLTDIVVYGQRNPSLDYLIPIIFLRPTQHNLKERDNALIALDTEVIPVSRVKLYGTLLLDELQLRSLQDDWWANKFGWQAGVQGVLPVSFASADLTLEWTKTRPWLYTHKHDYTSFAHDDRCLGFYAGPNSELWYLENNWQFSPRVNMQLSYRYLRHGVEELAESDSLYYPLGTDVNQSYLERDRDLDRATADMMGKTTVTQDLTAAFDLYYNTEVYCRLKYNLHREGGAPVHYYSAEVGIDY